MADHRGVGLLEYISIFDFRDINQDGATVVDVVNLTGGEKKVDTAMIGVNLAVEHGQRLSGYLWQAGSEHPRHSGV